MTDASTTDAILDTVNDARGQYAHVYRAELVAIATHPDEPPGRISRAAVQAVWTALASFTGRDVDGGAWPSDGTLGELTGMAPGNVRRCREYLRAVGLLTWTPRFRNGHQTSNAYTLVGLRAETLNQARATGACIDPQPGACKARDDHSPDHSPHPDHSPEDQRLPEIEALCDQLADSIAERGNPRPTVTAAWYTDMERLVRIDGRDLDAVRRVIAWLHAGGDDVAAFWRTNVRSPAKLRAKWGTMLEQYERLQHRRGPTAEEQQAVVSDTLDQFSHLFDREPLALTGGRS